MNRMSLENNNKNGRQCEQLLIAVAERLRKNIRRSDIIARLGGDEFVILLEDITDKKLIIEITKEIFRELNQPFFISGQNILMNICVGISIYPENGEDKNTLLKNADQALYNTKKTGRNKYDFYSSGV